MENPILKVVGLSHTYGNGWAIVNIGLEVSKTGIVGLLGSNGAGKSTTMNIICGVLNQTKGNVYIDGIDMSRQPKEAKKRLGFLPQNAPLHLELTVKEYLTYCAYIRDIADNEVRNAVEVVMKKC